MNWATTQNNLGFSLRWLGTLSRDPLHFDAAKTAFDDCLRIRTRKANPFGWAQTQWNLADLAIAQAVLAPDPAHPDTARTHLGLAREVFAEAEDNHQLSECDRLLAEIESLSQGGAHPATPAQTVNKSLN